MSGCGAPTGMFAPHARVESREIGPSETQEMDDLHGGRTDGTSFRAAYDPENPDVHLVEDTTVVVEIDAAAFDTAF